MTYDEAVEYIHSVSWKGSVPGLSRITELCKRLGDPQKKLRFIHIAGTNGKGSVSAMLYSVLNAAGVRAGLFTSPYLVKFNERMSALGHDISDSELASVVEAVRPAADSMEDRATEFELITACAFEYFVRKGCDTVVLECGMGGRLDSTNVIGAPVISAITNIALDHTGYLGDTEEKIAAEKAGIIKGSPVVCGTVGSGAEDVIRKKCADAGSPLVFSRDADISDVRLGRDGISFTFEGEDFYVPLCGMYQTENIRTVLCALRLLRQAGYCIGNGALRRGLASVRWKGRFETLSTSPLVIFDGAHNPDGARFTEKTFSALYPGERAVIVTGVMADKDYRDIADSFSRICDRAFTISPNNPRALGAAAYADALSEAGIYASPCKNAEEALSGAVEEAARTSSPVLCAGSLYMYAEIVSALAALGLGSEKSEQPEAK
mgnify:FL=1